MTHQLFIKGSINKKVIMKKLFVIVCLFFAAWTVNAQFYLGGSTGFNFMSTQYDGDKESTSSFNISILPDMGYYVSDRFNVGAEIGFGISGSSTADEATVTFVFVPYVRYSIFQAGKFEVLGKGSLNTEFKKEYSYLGIHVDPVLAYNVNEHIMLQANLKFLSFRTYYEGKDTYSNVGMKFGIDANNVASLGGLTFGFIYKF
jgi:outer membrane protein